MVPGCYVPGSKVHGWKIPGWRVPSWKVHGWKVQGWKVYGWKVQGWNVLQPIKSDVPIKEEPDGNIEDIPNEIVDIYYDQLEDWYETEEEPKLEIVMNELRKNQNFHFDLQIHPTLLYMAYSVAEWYPHLQLHPTNLQ